MALFFDLSIPFVDSGASSSSAPSESRARKDARLKAVVRAMELGYAGVAYDRPFRGVLSDADRCQIPPFPLASLLKVAPALAASASFHRDLLGAPRSVPFRQYTRLTVSAAGTPAVLSLNGCHVLRTYDLVAVRPLSQDAFDKACEASEANIIALDISQKLPFRLKLPLVKLAIQRGLYFEITYSHLIADVHVRRQTLSDVKLLAEWTRGKNLIISSAATSITEVRGPHDVINLAAYLLGLSMDRARASISGNCRALVANALKKKQFHKEAIRVERITPSEQFDSKRFWIGNWNDYDPLTSREGDLPSLDDISRSISPASKPSVRVNPIDFTPLNNQAPSMLSRNTATMSPKCPPLAPADTHVSDGVSHYDDPVLTGMSMLLAEAKHSGQVVETDGMLKAFDESPLTSDPGPISPPTGLRSPCEIPSASDDAMLEVNRCLYPLVIKPLEQHKSACEDFLPSGSVTLITEARESDGVFEIDGHLKTSDKYGLPSDGITKPSCNATLRACNSKAVDECDFLSLESDSASLVAIEIKQVPDIVMEDHEFSHFFNESQVKMSTGIAQTMDCTPIAAHDQILAKNDHLSFACSMAENVLREQVEPKVLKQEQKDEHMIDDEMLYQKALSHPQLDKKGHCIISSGLDVIEAGFVETKLQEGETLLFENDASLKEGIVVLQEDMLKPPLTTKEVHSETKSGSKNNRVRLLHPAYPLPFKSLLKPILFKKKLCKSKDRSKIRLKR